ncbi:ribosome biogenesis GTPase Der [Oenococcus sicerae]|uniref:GTPase Der n=1 Tax=Oenococcus sicerae TaxID=2203724 RepID=A0AAJ1R914_9LACO|nr:ribosome biogenesis GTPase Der [Oenococcus sicerae]MDN6899755.1 ribosome biogenesis GTPase Der [Oenococcus sicerae]QAS70444.1 ribosome biogenesis GTPase Der [Oenococcus sicerae]
MSKKYTIAIVGRPNVGKSTLFNRIVGVRKAIVDDLSGVTRDRLYEKAEWNGVKFSVIDTGGISSSDDVFVNEIKEQAELAIAEADAIIFVVDGHNGITQDDELVAKVLYQSQHPIYLAVNHLDNIEQHDLIFDFYALGLGDPYPISAVHGIGVGDMLDSIIKDFKENEDTNASDSDDEDQIRIAIIGRPNVGKSSIFNALIKQNRSIISNIEGTTRDAIDAQFVDDQGRVFTITDTAGIRKSGKIIESTEKYSVLRAQMAIESADVILVVIDASTGIQEQDKHIAGLATEEGRAVIIVVNKWDAVEKDNYSMQQFTDNIREEFKFLDYAPIMFVSAKSSQRIDKIPDMVVAVDNNHKMRIQSSILNQTILDAIAVHPTPTRNGKRLRVYYATEVAVAPPTFAIFVNDPKLMHFSYQRYLENQIRENFDFAGTPIRLRIRARK